MENQNHWFCKELNADILIIDDKKAIKTAEYFGVNCVGSAGILLRAKELKYIDEIKPFF